MTAKLTVAVVGCGLMGQRRATVAAAHARCSVRAVVDVNRQAAQTLAAELGCAALTDWRAAVDDPAVHVIVVATPNRFAEEVTVAALAAGKHVLAEKPMGRSLAEAERMAAAAEVSGQVLKIGFNHRYHPALEQMHDAFTKGRIGRLIHLRARYGHGGRPGYEREWRGNAELAGGGELLDQGVHVLDLMHWFAGPPARAVAFMQTAVWPVAPLEDGAFAMLAYPGGPAAHLHTSWTQWKNLFSFEVHGELGSLTAEGLGGSYGTERLITAIRRREGGAPHLEEVAFEGPDASWRHEWDDFVGALEGGRMRSGTPVDSVAVMRVLDALYRSAREERIVRL